MATPHVTGVVALLWKKWGGSTGSVDPKTAANLIEKKLKDGCKDLGSAGYDTTFGFGLVDAKKSGGY